MKGAVNLVGPMDGKYILTYIDYYSSYPDACVLKEITSHKAITAMTNIFARFEYPKKNLCMTTANNSSAQNSKRI